jgi:hypothetical protein
MSFSSFLEGTKLRKMIAAGFTALFLASGAGAAVASHTDDRDEHKPQDHGLCTAFFNGNKNGWEKNGTPPPFQDLMDRADDGNDDTTNDVETYCGTLIGGNPGPNGQSDGKGQGGN